MIVVLVLALAWITANAALVLMLRRNARVRDTELGRASRVSEPAPAAVAHASPLGDALGRP